MGGLAITETARARLVAPFSDPRLVAHYFRTNPEVAWEAFVKGPIVHALVYSWRGHIVETNLGRLLGCCDGCGVWEVVGGE